MANSHLLIRKGLTFEPTAAPANPVEGDIYFDATLNKLLQYKSGSWNAFGSGSSNSLSPVNYIDRTSTSLPSSSPYSPDGTPVVTGDIVLFTNLSSNNNRFYKATVSGGSVTWALQILGQSLNGAPTIGDSTYITSGSVYANRPFFYNGSAWANYTTEVRGLPSGAGTNLDGGTVVVAGGASTGNGGSVIQFQIARTNQGSGTTVRSAARAAQISDDNMLRLYEPGTTSSIGIRAATSTNSYTVQLPASAPTTGQVLTATSSSATSWQTPSASGANTTLSNLASPTAINQDLTPDTGNVRNIGSSSLPWQDITAREYIAVAGPNLPPSSLYTGSGITMPDGIPVPTGILGNGTNSIGITSANNVIPDSTPTGSVALETGNKTAGTGNSGNIILYTGTSSGGTRGTIYISPELRLANSPSSNYVGIKSPSSPTSYTVTLPSAQLPGFLLNDGSGNLSWTTSTGGANTNLSNLTSPTAINQDLLPDASNTRYLGSAVKRWDSAYLDRSVILSGTATGGFFGPNQGLSTPSSATAGVTVTSNTTNSSGTVNVSIYTGNNASPDSTPSSNVLIETGNKTAGTGNSGDINLKTGTSSGGIRGKVILDGSSIDVSSKKIINLAVPTTNADAATKKYVDDTVAAAGGGANNTLSNLGTTNINSSLIPATPGTLTLGLQSSAWNNTWANVHFTAVASEKSSAYTGGGATIPSGATVDVALLTYGTTYGAGSLGFATENNATANSTSTGGVRVETGNKTAGTGNSGDIVLQTGTSSGGIRGTVHVNPELRLDGSTSGYVGIKSPASPTSYTVTLPSAQGASNTVLTNDGSGNLSWTTSTGTGNVVFSASPTLTGTTNVDSIQAAGQITVGSGSVTSNAIIALNGGTSSGWGSGVAFQRGGATKGYVGTDSFIAGNNTSDIAISSIPGSGAVKIYSQNTTPTMTLDTSSNVGIGTTSPATKLDVVGSIRAKVEGATYGGLNGGLVAQRTTDDSQLYIGFRTTPDVWAISATYTSTGAYKPLAFLTSDTERMRIDSSGNVGIGTTSPGISTSAGRTYLTLVGSTAAGFLELGTNAADAASTRVGGIQFSDKNATGGKVAATVASSLEGSTANNRGGRLEFFTKTDNGSTSERMRIDSSGNVGIGTTTPDSGHRLHVANSSASALMRIETGSNFAAKAINFYNTNQYNWLAGSDILTTNTFQIVPSTAAGGTTYTTAAMTLDTSGNVGIGTTSPATKLDVTGNAKLSGNFTVAGSASTNAMISINGTSTNTGTTQRGFENLMTSTSAATAQQGYLSNMTTGANSAINIATNFFSHTLNKGASSTVSTFVGYRETGSAPHPATNNASIADNVGFTGNWFINQAGTDPSTLGGSLGIGTTSPGVPLDTVGSIRSQRSGAATQNIVISGGDAGGIYVTANMLEAAKKQLTFQAVDNSGGSAGGTGGFLFQTGHSSAPSTVVTIAENGDTTFTGSVTSGGSFSVPLTAQSGTSYNITAADHTVLLSGVTGTITATLPTAVGIKGRIYTIKRTGTGATSYTVNTTSSQTIDGATTYTLSAQYKYVSVQSDGANWVIIANN